MAKKLTLIINPAAGKGEGSAVGGRLLDMYSAAGYEYQALFTRTAGDAARFAAQCNETEDVLVCVGGDGTMSETLTGLLKAKKQPPLCYVPLGSTNDLAYSLQLPMEPLEAGRLAIDGEEKWLDAGRFDEHVFSYVASFGAFTSTSYETDRALKNKLGHFAYVLTGARELPNIRAYPVRVECKEGLIEGRFLFGAVCNASRVGGTLKLPVTQDNFCDGKLELFMVREPRDLSEIPQLLLALASGNYTHELIECHTITQATFHMPEEMPWSLDGEKAMGGRRVEISALEKAYQLMMPSR